MNTYKPHSIEQKAINTFGLTEAFELAGYILPNGEMLNFSYDGLTRCEDHRIIGQFFKTASGTDAMLKFMNRGSIRVMCNRDRYNFEYIKEPTSEQTRLLRIAMKDAKILGKSLCIEHSDKNGKTIEYRIDEDYSWR